MPKGPQGQKRPADAVGLAVLVGRIATGEVEESLPDHAKREAGKAGAAARGKSVSRERAQNIAKAAAKKRWPSQY